MRLLARDSGRRARSPWLISQLSFEHVVIISPSAASTTSEFSSENPRSQKGATLRTRLPGIATRRPRAHVLVLHEPLIQAPHDASPAAEIRVAPRFLRLRREADFVRDLLLAVRLQGREMRARRGVEAGDVPRAGDHDRGAQVIVLPVRI